MIRTLSYGGIKVDMNFSKNYWSTLDALIDSSEIKIDRLKGSAHPRYPDYIYPYDYGFITDTNSTDDQEIDCWVGSKRSSKLDSKHVDGIIVTFDPTKRDSEVKVLVNCTEDDMQKILKCHNRGSMSGMLIQR